MYEPTHFKLEYDEKNIKFQQHFIETQLIILGKRCFFYYRWLSTRITVIYVSNLNIKSWNGYCIWKFKISLIFSSKVVKIVLATITFKVMIKPLKSILWKSYLLNTLPFLFNFLVVFFSFDLEKLLRIVKINSLNYQPNGILNR